MAAQAQIMTRHDLEAKTGDPCELREEDLEKVAGGSLVVLATVHVAAVSTMVSISISKGLGGW
jgi:hypothetical protein